MENVLQLPLTAETLDMLQSYICVLSEMTVLVEARSTLQSSLLCFRTLCRLLHTSHYSIVHLVVQLLTRECEENDGFGDLIAKCFLEECNVSEWKDELRGLQILIELLSEDVDINLKMVVLKFLAVLVYSIKSLPLRVKVRLFELKWNMTNIILFIIMYMFKKYIQKYSIQYFLNSIYNVDRLSKSIMLMNFWRSVKYCVIATLPKH